MDPSRALSPALPCKRTPSSHKSAIRSLQPLETMDETLRHCMPFVEEMVTLGLVERADAADQIWNALVASGLVQQRGADAVQCILANGLTRKEHESVERERGLWRGIVQLSAATTALLDKQ